MTDRQENRFGDLAEAGPHGELASCPECGGVDLHCVNDGELTNFFCPSCASCWHVELGWVHRIDPATCPGCAFQPLCLAKRGLQAPPAQATTL